MVDWEEEERFRLDEEDGFIWQLGVSQEFQQGIQDRVGLLCRRSIIEEHQRVTVNHPL